MKAALGVSIGRGEATVALLDAAAPHGPVDQSRVDLSSDPVGTLTSVIVSTERTLTRSGQGIASTRICGSDPDQAARLTDALADANLPDVAVISRSDAMTELVRSLADGEPAAVVATDEDTVSLSIVGADSTSVLAVESIAETDSLTAYSRLLAHFREQPGSATSIIVFEPPDGTDVTTRLVGECPVRLVTPNWPDFAVARGAALAGLRSGRVGFGIGGDSDTEATETVRGPQSENLAYSDVGDSGNSGNVYGSEPNQKAQQTPAVADEDLPTGRPRMLLLGSTMAAAVVVGFAVLAVIVAINIQPTVTQQAVRTQEEALPGKFFPMTPGQGVKPDGDNWTVVENLPAPGQWSDVRVFEPVPLRQQSGVAATAPIRLALFPDGTLGVGTGGGTGTGGGFDPLAYLPPIMIGQSLPPITIGQSPAAVPDAGITGMDLVARLVPDFSRIDLTSVILSLINNAAATNPLETMAATLLSLNNAGSIGLVRADQGTILTGQPVTVFADPPATLLEKVNSGVEVSALPTEAIDIPAVSLTEVPATADPETSAPKSSEPKGFPPADVPSSGSEIPDSMSTEPTTRETQTPTATSGPTVQTTGSPAITPTPKPQSEPTTQRSDPLPEPQSQPAPERNSEPAPGSEPGTFAETTPPQRQTSPLTPPPGSAPAAPPSAPTQPAEPAPVPAAQPEPASAPPPAAPVPPPAAPAPVPAPPPPPPPAPPPPPPPAPVVQAPPEVVEVPLPEVEIPVTTPLLPAPDASDS